MHSIVVIAALCGFVLAPTASSAQQREREIPDAVTCSRCVVNLRPVVTLSTGDTALTWIPDDVTATRDGSVFVAEFGALPRRFARDGKFLGTLGAQGSGPGEFTGTVGFSLAAGDSLLVSQVDGRVIVVDPTGTSRRQVTLPTILFPLQVIEWPHRVLAMGAVGSTGAASNQMHVFDLSGTQARVVHSFGGPRGRTSAPIPHKLAAARDGGFWVSDPLEYRVARWSATGESLSLLRRSPDWFAGRSEAWLGNPTTPPPSQIIGIAEDAEGLLWVYTRRARSNWRAGWPRLPEGTREMSSRMIDHEKLFEVVVEVVDTRRGRVVVRQALRQLVVDVLDNGDIVTYRSVGDGLPELSILRPRLTRP